MATLLAAALPYLLSSGGAAAGGAAAGAGGLAGMGGLANILGGGAGTMAGSTLGGGMQGATQGSGLMGALSGGGGGALMNNVGSLGSSFSSSSQPQAPGIQLTDPLKNIKLANTSGRYSYE